MEHNKKLDELLEDALDDAPTIKGYTIKQLAEITEAPWPTAWWHLERLESRAIVEHFNMGRAKLYSLKKKREGRCPHCNKIINK